MNFYFLLVSFLLTQLTVHGRYIDHNMSQSDQTSNNNQNSTSIEENDTQLIIKKDSVRHSIWSNDDSDETDIDSQFSTDTETNNEEESENGDDDVVDHRDKSENGNETELSDESKEDDNSDQGDEDDQSNETERNDDSEQDDKSENGTETEQDDEAEQSNETEQGDGTEQDDKSENGTDTEQDNEAEQSNETEQGDEPKQDDDFEQGDKTEQDDGCEQNNENEQSSNTEQDDKIEDSDETEQGDEAEGSNETEDNDKLDRGDKSNHVNRNGLNCQRMESWPKDWVTYENKVLDLVNENRRRGASCGGQWYPPVSSLTLNSKLIRSSRCHALDMVQRNYFEHVALDGSTMSDRIKRTGYSYRSIGENIAYGAASPKWVVQLWMNSPGHCKNIMTNFKEIGIGYVADKHMYVQNFGTSF